MPSNPNRNNTDKPASTASKGTATYSSKDGSKFITVRKPSAEGSRSPDIKPSDRSSASNKDMAHGAKNLNDPAGGRSVATPTEGNANNGAAGAAVNRKKQKRREKQAAKQAAELATSGDQRHHVGISQNGHSASHHGGNAAHSTLAASHGLDYTDANLYTEEQFEALEDDDLYYSDDEGQLYRGPYDTGNVPTNGHPGQGFSSTGSTKAKKSKKKKKGKVAELFAPEGSLSNPPALQAPPLPPPPPPPLSMPTPRPTHSISRDRIWNTSTQEERERIKEFWLSLGEEDRRSLVKVEKEAVLRKMKEQQKHSCSCTVCGRKRTAIEEELEVLYDAYYEELEQYANHQQARLEDGTPMMPPPRRYAPPAALHSSDRLPPLVNTQQPSKSRIEELADDDEEDEDYSDEDDDEEEYSDEEDQEVPQGAAADFFNFGGILTVADDLLKNDGKKFIEMMEQLAERRMQREEEAQYAASGLGHPSMNMAGHNHAPLPEEEEYDDEEDEDYDSQEDEDYEDDEMDTMTEEQRMEEGRRMFQIFAARMFEQRVLTAYREKVAQERQKKLLEELEEETRLDVQREQKKAKEAQKKKDKKRLQKQAKDEEKARKDAAKVAEEAAAREAEEKKADELRRKKDEQRKKREAEKRAQDEERQRKEAEKQRKVQEERERQAELERKQREQKEREKKKREDAKRKERDEREAKEKASKDKKEREEKERREREAKTKADKEAKDRARREEQAAQQATAQSPQSTQPFPSAIVAAPPAKRPSQPLVVPPPGLQHPQRASGVQSPQLQVATPAIPKAPTPIRPRQASQQGSVGSSPQTPQVPIAHGQSASPTNSAPQQNSPGLIGTPGKAAGQQPPFQQIHGAQSMPPTMASPPGVPFPSGPAYSHLPSIGGNGPTVSQPPNLPGLPQRALGPHEFPSQHQQMPMPNQYRGFMPPGNMPAQPQMSNMRAAPAGRGVYPDRESGPQLQTSQQSVGLPNAPVPKSGPRDTMPSHSHSRHQSASLDKPSFENPNPAAPTQPIARPAPIKRPSSANRQRGDDRQPHSNSEIEDLSSHLGSSALLDDTDDTFLSEASSQRRGSAAPGLPGPGSGRPRYGFPSMFPPAAPTKTEGLGLSSPVTGGDTWGAPHIPFRAPGVPGGSTWSNGPGPGWSNPNTFGVIGGPNRATPSRPVAVRLMICQACKDLSAGRNGEHYHDVHSVLRQVDQFRPASEHPVSLREMMEILETEGDAHNGGGYFSVRQEGGGRSLVKHEVDAGLPAPGRGFAPGEIGSPITGPSMPAFGGPRPYESPSNMASPSGF
ncbi:MAG: Stress response protein nst1 [Piccolia ochrophora]|nr:MAG: Stress response protein nst1 [Piccolia ochrophora]